MFKSPARRSFEDCPNRTTPGGTTLTTRFVLRCAAYPEGMKTPYDIDNVASDAATRTKVAQLAGCVGCTLGEAPLERVNGMAVSTDGAPVEIVTFKLPEAGSVTPDQA